MASRRNGDYHDIEYKERDPDYGESNSRLNFAYSKDEYDRMRNGIRVRDRDVPGRDRVRVRQRDIKERELANGGYRSSSSRSDSGGSGGRAGPRRCDYSARAVDREPGELSSESGSDGAVESEALVRDVEVSKTENGAPSPPVTKKRKFSPIVWDRDDKGTKDALRSRAASTPSLFPPPPPPGCKSYRQSPLTIPAENNEILSAKSDKSQESQEELESSPPKAPVERGSMDNVLSESPSDHPNSISQGQRWGTDEPLEPLEDEDYIPTRHILSSRWADDATSPADEGEISDDEDMRKRRRKMPSSEFLDAKRSKKSSSPETGGTSRGVSDLAKGRSSDSDGSMQNKPSSGDRGLQNDLEREDHMKVDDKCNDTDASLSPRDTESEEEDCSRQTTEPPAVPKRTVNMLQGCRSVDEFERLNKIDEGTYGVVYRARDRKTGEIVALKKVKMEKEREGFPLTSLREINILLSLHHPSIVDVKEVVVGSSLDSIFMVMEYMEHDLKALMETMKQPFSQSEVKCLMLQLLEGIKYLHDNWVLHRDLKTSNLLLNNQGELKICDFGLARQYGSPLKPYTHLVVTLWYRAPELLLGAKEYSTAIDMWSLGCIMAELLSKEPLFNGKSEFDQLDKIFRILGTPNETIWPGFSKLPRVKVNFVKHQYNQLRKKFPATSFTGSPVLSDAGFDLLNRLLTYDPEKRITADAALKHEWFREVPLPKSKEFMPTFPAQHAQDRRMRRVYKSPDPLEEQRRKELRQAELGTGGLFG